jgi:hypothetical protein
VRCGSAYRAGDLGHSPGFGVVGSDAAIDPTSWIGRRVERVIPSFSATDLEAYIKP